MRNGESKATGNIPRHGKKERSRRANTDSDFSFNTERVTVGDGKDANKWIEKYLGVGEWVMDQSVAIAGSSGWFQRTR